MFQLLQPSNAALRRCQGTRLSAPGRLPLRLRQVFGRKKSRTHWTSQPYPSPRRRLAHFGTARSEWKRGLMLTAAALSGHHVEDRAAVVLSAWRLRRSEWLYVAGRILRSEEGWRRARGLRLLRLIASKRRDLPMPVSRLVIRMPWCGSRRAAEVMRRLVMRCIRHWRTLGPSLPMLRHARLYIAWASSRSLQQSLCTHGDISRLVFPPPHCPCEGLLQRKASWPTICFEGRRHVVATQGEILPGRYTAILLLCQRGPHGGRH